MERLSTIAYSCVVYTTKIRFEGANATFGENIKFAISKIGLIIYWGFIVEIVALVMAIIRKWAEKAGQSNQLIVKYLTSIFGFVWGITTIFVIPAMVYHNLRPKGAIKKISRDFKENLGRKFKEALWVGLDSVGLHQYRNGHFCAIINNNK